MTGQRSNKPTKTQLRCQEQQHVGRFKPDPRPEPTSMAQAQRFQDTADSVIALADGEGVKIYGVKVERPAQSTFAVFKHANRTHYTVSGVPDYTLEQAITLAIQEVARVDEMKRT